MAPFLNGMAFGLIFIFSIGPAFFLLIQTSIEQGFKKAAFMALGISIGDILFVVLIMKGLASYLDEPDVRFWAGIVGVSLLTIVGIYSFFKIPRINLKKEKHSPEGRMRSFLTGLFFNLFNPSTIIFWLSLVSIVQINLGYKGNEKELFFAGVLCTILSTDLTKSYLAQKLKQFLTFRAVAIMNKVVGVILIGFGLRLLFELL